MSDLPAEPTQAIGPLDTTQATESAIVAGRYRLDALAGRGGSAEVWRATDTALDRVVALKLVTVPTDASAARAGEEARTLARLSHPSLVPVYDAGTDSIGRPWVVMEFVEGETLGDALRRGPLPAELAAATGRSVAEALEHVHAQGLVHRDVKPANVLIGVAGRVRLTDFGIARLVDAAKVTSTGLMVGTASYLAPEQVAGEPVGPPADIYALGLVLLESLSGEREYAGSTVEVALARLHRQPVIPPTVPPGWAPLLVSMTDREPGRRPTAGQVALALRDVASFAADQTQVLPPLRLDQETRLLPVVPPVGRPGSVAPVDSPGPLVPADGPGPLAPRPGRPVARPALSVPAEASRPRRSRGKGVLVALLALVLLLGAGGYAVSQAGGSPAIKAPATNLPERLRGDLRQLQQQVAK